jgi:ubiquinone/menaquinone biosynthesis C-methylase UbiE
MHVQATDFDPAQIELARKTRPEGERLRFRVEDATCLSFPDSSFDLVISQDVFHHIPDWGAAVREVARVLRPRGYFVWFDMAFHRIVKKVFLPITKNYGLYTFDEIESAFEANGFHPRSHRRLRHGPFTYHHMVLGKA